MSARILVAGLGNMPFPATRHSIGHFVVESLSQRVGAHLAFDKSVDGYHAETRITMGDKLVTLELLKTKPLMNVSGPSVAAALRKNKLSPSSLILIHDSLEHRPATISPKFGGSHNGHNGVRSVISALGSKDFHRLRIGIGRSDRAGAAVYVLGRLSSHEREYWGPGGAGIDVVWQHIESIALQDGSPR
ncbi:peptidyl-tRNA hydrolase [Dentipellis sp. KUC8613]|nr:peptidyl-tRNA hydrolase [Dentipellis sp. KUC8613]